MSKYSDEYKLQAVKACLSREGSFEANAENTVPQEKMYNNWVAQYNLAKEFTKPAGHSSGEFRL